jgi:non-homologous end joining protein Ku
MAEKKKKLKPFKTAAGAVQFMRNFDLDNMVDSSREEIDKMMDIFEREHKKLGPKKFKEKYAGKTLNQVEQRLEAMRFAQMAEGNRKLYGEDESVAKMYDKLEKGRLDLEKELGRKRNLIGKKKKSGNSRGGLTKTGHTDYRKTGLFR